MDDDTPLSAADAGLLRYLRWLVTALSVTMIAGVIVLVAVVVMRFRAETAPTPWPETIALPAGTTAQAVTRGPDYLLVITTDGAALVFSPDGQTLLQTLPIGEERTAN